MNNERGRRSVPTLMPLFRSEAQFRLMGELFTNPQVESAVGELAARINASHPTVSREVERLSTAGLVRTRQQGNRTLVSAATTSPLFEDLRSLLTKVYGVVPVLREEFAGTADRLLLFGSWAARWYGESGPPPHDIDVLIVWDGDPAAVWEAAGRATRRLGMEVNVTMRTPQQWAADHSGFAEQVRTRPSIELDLPPRTEPAADQSPGPPQHRWG